ncbi:hypothetical protein E6W39_30000 [Kitasatospora acidiphila]|uniref:Type II toxin-antitoxin system RelE/ParE family toxin n=1 Tax=Kitasatospora acidiphila TaxID=2567942 RepID=A0A540W9J5_9ACTN|nr:hypothetical protein [Kitasatospora acidiphila]TQF05685.1 hypothetical protein E6W39_30000 [Kitasatospora acidiphila]
MSDWTWEYLPDAQYVVGGLPEAVVEEVESIAAELAVLNSMTYPEGRDFQGTGPGMRKVVRAHLMVCYTTFPRDEAIYIVQVTHLR